MRALVTGAAGFIGSTLVDRLLAEGHDVIGIDAFTDYYDPGRKRTNLAGALEHPAFTLVEGDINELDLRAHLDGIDAAWHLAGQPGVRESWSDAFRTYVQDNILATQRLLEAARTTALPRLVYSSSSSIYGNAERYPTLETDEPRPVSPYGVTKLAGEHLCAAYATNWSIPTIALRYFTVYGPRQRPDMATHRLIECALDQRPFPLYGAGDQQRTFTFVDDVVDATLRAGTAGAELVGHTVLNVSGTTPYSVAELIDLVGEIVGRPVPLDRRPAQAGDATRTGGSTEAIGITLGWTESTSLIDGVRAQVLWHRARRGR